jgi:hypothetical protein
MTLVRLIKSAALFALVAMATLGCSGINASKSFSPASFFLPGLIQNAPASPSLFDVTTNQPSSATLAQAR